MKKTIVALVILLSIMRLSAQSNTVSSGGEATGSGGTASFTTGEVFYTYKLGSTASVTEGVQQTYLVLPTGVISGGATVCAGTATQLSIAVTGQGPWFGTLSDGTGFSGSATPVLVTVTPTATTTYTIATLSSETATASATDLSGSATVTVNQPTSYYADADGDGYGAGTAVLSCSGQPVNTVANNTDCAPADGTKWQLGTFYTDADGDGYNNGAPQTAACYGTTTPSGYTNSNIGTDCLDSNFEVNPNHVEVLGNSIDDNCDGVVDEVAPNSAVLASQCGSTLTNLSNTIYCGQVSGAQGYRFEVTQVGNPSNVRTYDSENNRFNLLNLSGVTTYATTYSIRVAVKTAPGFWRSYSSTCSVTTPAVPPTTSISNPACGITLSNIETTIYCIAASNATGYRFRVTDGVTTRLVETTVNRFSLVNANANFATTYAVDVQLKFGTTWETTWGSVCSFTTPLTPRTSNVIPSQCGMNITNLWTTIYATQVSVATGYRFEVTKGAQTVYYDTPNSRFSLRNITVPGFTTTNASYSIRVSIKFNNIYQAFGTPCTITTNGASRITNKPLEVFEVNAYPNPFANNFKLEVNTSSEENVSIKVYDMLGRAIEVKQGNLSDMTSSEMGDQLTSGVYNVIVTQGEHVKTLRMIKR